MHKWMQETAEQSRAQHTASAANLHDDAHYT